MATISYPLYDNIIKKINGGNITFDLGELAVLVNSKATPEQCKIIYSLILHHHIIENKKNPTNCPYGCRMMEGGKGVIVTVTSLPLILQQVIFYYLNHSII